MMYIDVGVVFQFGACRNLLEFKFWFVYLNVIILFDENRNNTVFV